MDTVTSEQVEVIGSWGLLSATRDPKGRGSQQQGKTADSLPTELQVKPSMDGEWDCGFFVFYFFNQII